MKVLRKIKQFFCPHIHIKTEFTCRKEDGSIIYERKCLDCGAHLGFAKITEKNGKITITDLKEASES